MRLTTRARIVIRKMGRRVFIFSSLTAAHHDGNEIMVWNVSPDMHNPGNVSAPALIVPTGAEVSRPPLSDTATPQAPKPPSINHPKNLRLSLNLRGIPVPIPSKDVHPQIQERPQREEFSIPAPEFINLNEVVSRSPGLPRGTRGYPGIIAHEKSTSTRLRRSGHYPYPNSAPPPGHNPVGVVGVCIAVDSESRLIVD